MNKELVTVVIPIHLEKPSELEIISLDQILNILSRYPITFMAPTGLNVAWYEDYCRGKGTIHFERFDWKGFDAYSELMLSSVFYKRFLKYEYILNCHLDAFVFRDELEAWCRLGYDYIGSVIFNGTHWDRPSTLIRRLSGFTTPEYFGNGGFSLKKVKTFYYITTIYKPYFFLYRLMRKMRKRMLYDDIFLTNHFPKLYPSFSVPPKNMALKFAVAYEDYDEAALPFNNRDNNSLPFGTHGWIQNYQAFWRPIIRRYGYTIEEPGESNSHSMDNAEQATNTEQVKV